MHNFFPNLFLRGGAFRFNWRDSEGFSCIIWNIDVTTDTSEQAYVKMKSVFNQRYLWKLNTSFAAGRYRYVNNNMNWENTVQLGSALSFETTNSRRVLVSNSHRYAIFMWWNAGYSIVQPNNMWLKLYGRLISVQWLWFQNLSGKKSKFVASCNFLLVNTEITISKCDLLQWSIWVNGLDESESLVWLFEPVATWLFFFVVFASDSVVDVLFVLTVDCVALVNAWSRKGKERGTVSGILFFSSTFVRLLLAWKNK